MANADIRHVIEESGVKYWEIANEYGLTDSNFSRKLRTELLDSEKQKILDIIEKLKA